MQATIYIADDDEAVRDSLRILLEASGYDARCFASGAALLDAVGPGDQGCLIVDVKMPGIGGLDVQDRLREARLSLPVIVITGHGDVPLAVRAMKAGAVDFVEKPFTEEEILAAVERALKSARGKDRFGIEAADAEARVALLSERERQVMQLLVAGKPNKVIAYDLSISPRTVEIHRARVMEKTRAGSLSELVLLALAAGYGPGAG